MQGVSDLGILVAASNPGKVVQSDPLIALIIRRFFFAVKQFYLILFCGEYLNRIALV